jgi:hypothetical protein
VGSDETEGASAIVFLVAGLSPTKESFETNTAGAAGGDVEEEEAIEDSAFTTIQDWPESAGLVGLKVGHSHFAASDKRGDASEEAKGNHQAAKKFDDPGYKTLRVVKLLVAAQDSKEFLRAMAGEQSADYKASDGIHIIGVSGEEVFHGAFPSIRIFLPDLKRSNVAT